MKPFWSRFWDEAAAALREFEGVLAAVMDEYARLVPATAAGEG